MNKGKPTDHHHRLNNHLHLHHHPPIHSINHQLRRRLRGAKAGCGSFLGALWTTVKRCVLP